MYSEKATKILRNLPLTFDYSTYGQNFVAFSEYMNFMYIYSIWSQLTTQITFPHVFKIKVEGQ